MKMKLSLTICLAIALVLLTVGTATAAEAPVEEWNKVFGDIGHEGANSVQQTSEGGYIFAGRTDSYGAGGFDAWLVKTDSNGNEEWNKTFGGTSWDYAYSVQQTSDDGYAFCGCFYNVSAGRVDGFLIKTDEYGNVKLNKTFGAPSIATFFYSFQQTSDDGYILAGETYSSANLYDPYLVKTDSNGNEEWNKTFINAGTQWAYSVQQTLDGGYILAGKGTYIDEQLNRAFNNVWLIKTDEYGNEEWNKTFGDASPDALCSVQQTSEGGYVVTTATPVYIPSSYPQKLYRDAWLIKTDSNGNEEWNKTFGGSLHDASWSVQQTLDDGYILAGYTQSYGGTDADAWIIKTDLNGNEQWNKTIGYSSSDGAYSVQQTSDGYIVVGFTYSYDVGGGDAWLIKLESSNQPPVADANGPYEVDEGSSITFDASDSFDPDGDTLIYDWDFGDDSYGSGVAPDHVYADNGVYTVTLTVTDDKGAIDTATSTVIVNNVAPTIELILAPIDPVQVNTEITASADFTDPGADTHIAEWNWGDGTTSAGTVNEADSSVTGNHIYDMPGVYPIALTVTDDDGGTDSAIFEYVVVYDPDGGFVTGGGWLISPEGAYAADPSLTGKANFGFISKYKIGATVPTGQTNFRFKVANLNFQSDEYQWLVVAGSRAQYKGTGTINGEGEYEFMLSAIDAELTPSTDVDLFRIKIWDKVTNEIVYDNMMDAEDDADPETAIEVGSIKIHKSN